MTEQDIQDPGPSSPKPTKDGKKAAARTIDPRILTIARAIGRKIAQQQLKASQAANDNQHDKEQKRDD